MGALLSPSDASTHELRFVIAAPAPVERVDVIRSGEIVSVVRTGRRELSEMLTLPLPPGSTSTSASSRRTEAPVVRRPVSRHFPESLTHREARHILAPPTRSEPLVAPETLKPCRSHLVNPNDNSFGTGISFALALRARGGDSPGSGSAFVDRRRNLDRSTPQSILLGTSWESESIR
jgi:hypothetical protein